jgi:hypothetical protein
MILIYLNRDPPPFFWFHIGGRYARSRSYLGRGGRKLEPKLAGETMGSMHAAHYKVVNYCMLSIVLRHISSEVATVISGR